MGTLTRIGGVLPCVTVSGAPYERGVQKGGLLADMVAVRVDKTLRQMATAVPRETSRQVADRFMAVLERREPEVLEELRGIGDGAGIDWDDLRISAFGAGGGARIECSVFAATGPATTDGSLLLGKNGDLGVPFMTEQDAYVAKVTPDHGYRFIEMGTYPERVCQPEGMNERGLTVVGCGQKPRDGQQAYATGREVGVSLYDTMHTIYQHCATIEDALEVLGEAPRGYTGRTLLIGDATGRFAKVEVTFERMAVRWPEPQRSYPANFVAAGVSGTFSEPDTWDQVTDIAQRPAAYTRYDRYMNLLVGRAGSIDVAAGIAILGDHDPEPGGSSICKHTDGPTLEAYLYQPQSRTIWAANGHPCQAQFHPIGFDE
ncbi:MAG TPA: C45 family peptidase [Cellulomonas sp.]